MYLAFCSLSIFVVSLTCTFRSLMNKAYKSPRCSTKAKPGVSDHATKSLILIPQFGSKNFLLHSSPLTIHLLYSILKLFTGFAIVAFIAWKLIVINAINSAVNAAIINTHQLKLVL